MEKIKRALSLAAAKKAAECQGLLIELSEKMPNDSSRTNVLKAAKKVGKVSKVAESFLGGFTG